MTRLGFSEVRKASWIARLLVGSAPADEIAGLGSVLAQWQSPLLGIQLAEHPEVFIPRLDCRYTWCPWPDEIQPIQLVATRPDCSIDSTTTFVVASLSNCNLSQAISYATNAGASGLVLIQDGGKMLQPVGSDNMDAPNFPVTMISSTDGALLLEFIQDRTVNATLGYSGINGQAVSIDYRGRLLEIGWEKYATLEMLSWQAQHLNFLFNVDQTTNAPSYVIPVMDSVPMAYSATVRVPVPSKAVLLSFSRMYLEASLGCFGMLDRDCNVWDRSVSLNVECDSADRKDMASRRFSALIPADMESMPHRHQTLRDSNSAKFSNEPGGGATEIGRWITAFQRRSGRWITDVTPLMPLIFSASGYCNFTASTDYDVWLFSAKFRLVNEPSKTVAPAPVVKNAQPLEVLYLDWPNQQANFDSPSYNENRTIHFTVPVGTKQVILRALITGHGDCEFLPTSHHFSINGLEYNSTAIAHDQYMLAGTPMGCTLQVIQGTVPNEHGTWYFGRNGWCNGRDVQPLYWDVTAAVKSSGSNLISYRALSYDVGGVNPTDNGCGGYILLSNHLSFLGSE